MRIVFLYAEEIPEINVSATLVFEFHLELEVPGQHKPIRMNVQPFKLLGIDQERDSGMLGRTHTVYWSGR